MELSYDRLNTADRRGSSRSDYLIAFDADLRVAVGGETVYEDQDFPVVELARSLLMWIDDADRGDFEFDSMSFEEVGSIAFRQSSDGWRFHSVFRPGVATAHVDWDEVEAGCRGLITRVTADLAGLGLDPVEVLRP